MANQIRKNGRLRRASSSEGERKGQVKKRGAECHLTMGPLDKVTGSGLGSLQRRFRFNQVGGKSFPIAARKKKKNLMHQELGLGLHSGK